MYLKIKNAVIPHKYNHAERATCESRYFPPRHVRFKISKKTMKLQNDISFAEKLTDKNVLGLMVRRLVIFNTVQGLHGNK